MVVVLGLAVILLGDILECGFCRHLPLVLEAQHSLMVSHSVSKIVT